MAAGTDNRYAVPLEEAWTLFGDFLEGPRASIVLAASSGRLPDEARAALDSSFERLGWGACTFLAWPEGLDDEKAFFMCVEGLDPCALVLADARAADLAARAWRQDVPRGKAFRLGCRDCCAFEAFAAMLASAPDKQRAWAALKALSRRA